MQPAEIFSELQSNFTQNEIAQLLPALRQDALVWSALHEPDCVLFAENLKKDGRGENHSFWTPAQIAFSILGLDVSPSTLADAALVAPEETLRKRALNAYEEVFRNARVPSSLAEAGLIAIALRERRRIKQNWDGFGQEIIKSVNLNENEMENIWKTPLAILYEIIPDAPELLKQLIQDRQIWPYYSMIVHMILSNPLTVPQQIQMFEPLLKLLPLEQQLKWLKSLKHHAKDTLVNQLARNLLGSIGNITLAEKNIHHDLSLTEEELTNAVEMHRLATLYQLSGQYDKAVAFLQDSQEVFRFWLAGVEVQFSEISAQQGNIEKALGSIDQVFKLKSDMNPYQNELVLMLGSNPHAKTLINQLPEGQVHPFVKIQQSAMLADQGDLELAKEQAREAVNETIEIVSRDQKLVNLRFSFNWQPVTLVDILNSLGLANEALQLATLLLQTRPVDVSLISVISQILVEMDDLPQALYYAEMAIFLDSNNPILLRKYAAILEATGEFAGAYSVWRQVIESSEDSQSQIEDWVGIARTAHEINLPKEVILACNNILSADSNHYLACLLLGEAYMLIKEFEIAATYLSKASLLNPDDAHAWLQLAESYRLSEKPIRMIETLRTAVLSVPKSMEINYALAVNLLDAGSISDALPFLKKSVELSPESLPVTLRLIRTLVSLGQMREALTVVDAAREKWVEDPELALEQANILIEIGDQERALPALEIAIQSPNAGFYPYFLYASTLLGRNSIFLSRDRKLDYARLINAQHALEKALLIDEHHFESRLLMAEILGFKGNYENAIQVYRRLVDDELANQNKWLWRVQGGLGHAAQWLGQVETALAALQTAVQENPNHRYLQQFLAETCLLAHLHEETMHVAKNALGLAPDDIGNLSWFADIAVQLHEEDEAINALQCASQLAQNPADYLVKLAELQLHSGKKGAVHETLAKLMRSENVVADHCQRAAEIFLNFGEFSSALSCYEKAILLGSPSLADMLFVCACLYAQSGYESEAFEAVQKAIEITPDDYSLYLLQADLYTLLDRPQAAIACLDHALNAVSDENENATCANRCSAIIVQILPEYWVEILQLPSHIHMRYGYLLRFVGDISSALDHIQFALKSSPDDCMLQYMAADLTLALLDWSGAKERIENCNQPNELSGRSWGNNWLQHDAWVALTAMRAEMALDKDEEILAGRLLKDDLDFVEKHARINAVRSRILVRQGNWVSAQDEYEKAKSILQSANNDPKSKSTAYDFNIFNLYDYGREFWMVEAAIEANDWKYAMETAERLVAENPHEPRAHALIAKLLTVQTEYQLCCEELRCVTHAPEIANSEKDRIERFEQELTLANSWGSNTITNYWSIRGNAVFHPSSETVRGLFNLASSANDTAALVLLLRTLGNTAAAIQIGQRYPKSPFVQAQVALCYLKTEPEQGFEIARNVVSAQPSIPLFHATLAQAASLVGDNGLALTSIETALKIWGDEPEWFAWAGELAGLLNDLSKKVDYFKEACSLKPDYLPYAISLGEAYLDTHQINNAVELLNEIVRKAPSDPRGWYLLAKAFLKGGNHKESIRCAEKSSFLAEGGSKALVIAGQASLAQGKQGRAMEYFREAFAIDSSDAKTLLEICKIYTQQKKYYEAIDLIEKSLPLITDPRPILNEKVKLIWHAKGPAEALPLAEELVAENPQDVTSLIQLANLLSLTGKFEKAEQTAFAALRLEPNNLELNLLMGKLQRKHGQLDQAVHFFSESIRQSPTNMEGYLELANTYRERRENLQALKVYQQATKILPNDYRAFTEAACVMRELKDYVGAETMFRKAVQIAPEDLSIRKQLSAIIALNLVHSSREVNTLL